MLVLVNMALFGLDQCDGSHGQRRGPILCLSRHSRWRNEAATAVPYYRFQRWV